MTRTAGKVTFGNLLFFGIVFFCGFVLVKFIISELQVKNITGEIIDTLGPERRSADFNPDKAIEMVYTILKNNQIDTNDALVDVQFSKSTITFQVEYEKKIDYIIFKYKKKYTINDSLDRYGM